jgi:hypothetical protein
MADNTHMYNEIKDALFNQLVNYLNAQGEKVDVYKVSYQNIPAFPAVALELERRRKPKKGVGVKQLELDLIVWVYVDIYDAEDAERECLRLTEIVEDALESDLTLNSTAHRLSIDQDAEFGAIQTGEASFLQGSQLRVQVIKRFT